MNDIGTITQSSSYIASSFSAYKSTQTTSVEKQDNLGVRKTSEETPDDDINDTVTISDEAIKLYNQDKSNNTEKTDSKQNKSGETSTKTGKKLSKQEEQEITQLKARDTEVKTHEQAHLAAAGGLNTTAPSYTYQTGPDGNQYAIGGEVGISFSKSNDPQENIQKAQTMKAAALAPADPSGQDRSVAQSAEAIIASEEQKLKEQKSEKANTHDTSQTKGTTDSTETTGTTAEESTASKLINV